MTKISVFYLINCTTVIKYAENDITRDGMNTSALYEIITSGNKR
jgi:hypothetical protein